MHFVVNALHYLQKFRRHAEAAPRSSVVFPVTSVPSEANRHGGMAGSSSRCWRLSTTGTVVDGKSTIRASSWLIKGFPLGCCPAEIHQRHGNGSGG